MDPQERTWYDKHKDAILMKSGHYEDNEVSIAEYFSVNCFSGFGDGADGFFAIYAKLFKDISEDDYTFMNADEDDYPQFGDSQTDPVFIAQVFYGFWQSYSTKRSYVWEEEYDSRTAPNRWVRRKMEQENTKVREQAKRERSQGVQTLVDFVRRRDPRVKEYRRILEEKQIINDEKAKKKREEKLMGELIKAAKYEEDNRQRLEEENRRLEELERELGFDKSDTESFYTEEECDSLNAQDLEVVNEYTEQKIKEKMMNDEKIVQSFKDIQLSNSSKSPQKLSKKQKKKHRQQKNLEKKGAQTPEISSDEVENIIMGNESSRVKKSKKLKKKLKKQGIQFLDHSSGGSDIETLKENCDEGQAKPTQNSSSFEGDLNLSQSPDPSENPDEVIIAAEEKAPKITSTENAVEGKKLSAKEKRRIREKARQAEAKERKEQLNGIVELACKICYQDFETRNALFKHINETGHAEIKTTGKRGKNKKR